MSLFDILTNPIIIIVLLGFILKQFKKADKGHVRRPNPNLNPIPHPKHFNKNTVHPKPESDEPLIMNQAMSKEEIEPIETFAMAKTKEFKEKEVVKKPSTTHLKKTNIVDGIIWSEVLGPPRAYKKWSSKKE